jgi:hypothetical protein
LSCRHSLTVRFVFEEALWTLDDLLEKLLNEQDISGGRVDASGELQCHSDRLSVIQVAVRIVKTQISFDSLDRLTVQLQILSKTIEDLRREVKLGSRDRDR